MHKDILQLMFVKGPNEREDFHIAEGWRKIILQNRHSRKRIRCNYWIMIKIMNNWIIIIQWFIIVVIVFVCTQGSEFFFQMEGDMCLVILEQGEHKDVHIRAGEVAQKLSILDEIFVFDCVFKASTCKIFHWFVIFDISVFNWLTRYIVSRRESHIHRSGHKRIR